MAAGDTTVGATPHRGRMAARMPAVASGLEAGAAVGDSSAVYWGWLDFCGGRRTEWIAMPRHVDFKPPGLTELLLLGSPQNSEFKAR